MTAALSGDSFLRPPPVGHIATYYVGRVWNPRVETRARPGRKNRRVGRDLGDSVGLGQNSGDWS